MQGAARTHNITQRAINAITHDRISFKRLQMHIAGAITHRLREQGVNHPNDGRIIGHFKQIFHLRNGLHQTIEVNLVGGRINHCSRVARLGVHRSQ